MGRRGPKPLKAGAIARAALSLFVERGVKGATTREIAKRACTTEGSLYRYYAGKDELARRVLTRCLVEFGEAIAVSLEGVAGPRLRLRRFVRAYLEYANVNVLEHAFVCQSNFENIIGVPDEILRPHRILTDILSDGAAAGDFLPTEAETTACFIAGGLSRACRLPGSERRHALGEGQIEELCDMIERFVVCRSERSNLQSVQLSS